MTQVWACGGGTQSCAIAALIVRGDIDRPDWSVIADTGYEVDATWKYANGVLIPELKKVGVDLHIVKTKDYATVGMWAGKEKDIALIPLFSDINGTASKLPNYCTGEWKTRVCDRFLREQGVSDLVKWIGFSIDETTRVLRMKKSHPDTRFPLVEKRMSRRQCVELVESMGWPTPPRSRCYMCPNQGDHEWRELIANHPDQFRAAIELEQEIQKIDPNAWLHKSCVPLSKVDFNHPEDLFTRACDSGMCFV